MSGAGSENMMFMINVFIIVFLLLYFMVIRPRRKKERELEDLRKAIKIGDIVTTIGGIVGIVVSVKDDGLTIETGSDRNKIRIKNWAIRDIEKIDDVVVKAKEETQLEKAEKPSESKKSKA